MKNAIDLNKEQPAKPGVGQLKSSGRVAKFAAICTHCGVSSVTYPTRKKAYEQALAHMRAEHGA